MSLYDYRVSVEINKADYPFYAIIMAAMKQADTVNMMHLKRAFPQVYKELQQRYNVPGGRLPHEPAES